MVEAHLIAVYDQAQNLYTTAVADGAANALDPVNWLANEDAMRSECEDVFAHATFCNNSLADCMQFMCNSYPRGFGNAIKKSYQDGLFFDGCETFLQLGEEL